MTQSVSRPDGHYAKYKRATQHFLQWLREARSIVLEEAFSSPSRAPKTSKGNGKAAANEALQLSLSGYESVVNAIVKAPTALTPVLLGRWSRALAACESSITLREQFALYFPSTADPSTDGHSHFVARLKSWLTALRSVETTTPAVQEAKKDTGGIDFSNYYDVLSLSDDYFSTDDSASVVSTPPSSAKPRAKDSSLDEAFANDLDMELASLFAELDELSETVFQVYADVKSEKKTLVEAALVTKVAIQCGKAVIASLQALYSSIRTANDLMALIQSRMSGLQELTLTVVTGWVDALNGGDLTRDSYVRGSVIVDLVAMTQTLTAFAVLIPASPHSLMSDSVATKLGAYDEETTPHLVVPSLVSTPVIMIQQLTFLFNVVASNRQSGVQIDRTLQLGWYLDLFEPFFRTKTPTIDVVFVCICWVRSIAALQGYGGLARNVGYALHHAWDLEDRLQVSINRGLVHRSVRKRMETVRFYVGACMHMQRLMRSSPLFAGVVMLDNTILYLRTVADGELIPDRLAEFGLVYLALRSRNRLPPIPFVEGVLLTYERAIFASTTRATFEKGSFLTSYTLNQKKLSSKDASDSEPLSQVVRILESTDYAWLPPAWSSSWRSLLAHVSDVAATELFESRVLSRDLITLTDAITDLFMALARIVRCPPRGGGPLHHYVALAVLESLDLEAKGSEDTIDAVATVFRRLFLEKDVEKTYFLLPSTPAWASHVYGNSVSILDKDEEPNASTIRNARQLVAWLAQRSKPLSPTQLAKLKAHIRSDPLLLKVTTPPVAADEVELASIFHHAVAGPIRDTRLIEWLIGMGALYYESSHCRESQDTADEPHAKPNAMAVHCAAVSGSIDTLRHVLEAGGMRDLNTVTFRGRDSLMHLAAKHGHWSLCSMLEAFDIDTTKPNAAGQYAYDLASANGEASHRIRVQANRQRESKRRSASKKKAKRIAQASERVDVQRLEATLAKERELRVGIASHVKASKHGASELKDTQAAKRDALEAVDDSSGNLRGALRVLKHINHHDQPAITAVMIVDRLHAVVDTLVTSPVDGVYTQRIRDRVACDAMEVAHQLYRYHRQLTKAELVTEVTSPRWQLQQRASVSKPWVTFTVATVKLLLTCGRRAQAIELIEAMEKRMAKLSSRPPDFRACVRLYVSAREAAELSPRIASTPEMEKQFAPFVQR